MAKRIFWSKDHQSDADIIERAYPALQKANIKLSKESDRAKFVAEYRREKLRLIVDQAKLDGFELASNDQLPSDKTLLTTWLIRNQSKALTDDRQVFMDFRAPIEFEVRIVSENTM